VIPEFFIDGLSLFMHVDKSLPPKNNFENTVPFWHDPAKRAIVYQLATLAVVGLIG
jgi:hypothetical protein